MVSGEEAGKGKLSYHPFFSVSSREVREGNSQVEDEIEQVEDREGGRLDAHRGWVSFPVVVDI